MNLARTAPGLELLLELRSDPGGEITVLVFAGVFGLRFHGDETNLSGLVDLTYADISSRGWERARFHIADDEKEFISFYCEDFRRASTPR